ncbi:hypothetical protein F5887DRAFT_1086793 [Amanita rubescens]|nr:hypothetical protein F5887DRAFT_1086793 [Amanita rubescens]
MICGSSPTPTTVVTKDYATFDVSRARRDINALEWIRRSNESNPDQPANLICVYFGPKYEDPENNGNSAPKKRPRGKANTRIIVSPPLTSLQPKDNTPPPAIPSRKDIKVGAFYDPRLLSDFGGPLFKLKQAKLKQRHFVDINDELIAPWEEYDKLRTGTVVLMRVTLHTYTITEGNRDKKIYQIYADRGKVLATSDEPIDNRSIRFVLPDATDGAVDEQTDLNDDEQLKCFSKEGNVSDDNTASGSSSSSQVPTSEGLKPSKRPNITGITTRATSGKNKQPAEGKLSDTSKLPLSQMNVD